MNIKRTSGMMTPLFSHNTKCPAGFNNYKATEPDPAAETEYKVKKGDTLTAIAKQFNTTVPKLKKLNNIKSISAGDVLKIPEKG